MVVLGTLDWQILISQLYFFHPTMVILRPILKFVSSNYGNGHNLTTNRDWDFVESFTGHCFCSVLNTQSNLAFLVRTQKTCSSEFYVLIFGLEEVA